MKGKGGEDRGQVKRGSWEFYLFIFWMNLGFAACCLPFVEKQRENWEKGEEPGTTIFERNDAG